jgi:spermidine synthase
VRRAEKIVMRAAALTLVLFLSGASALIFQSLWLRVSGLAFGNSVWSAALILSSFMAGLAIGNAVAASRRWRSARPLRAYAGLEMTVAIFGCAVVLALPAVGESLRPLFQLAWSHHALVNAVRFVVSFLILLLPTSAMGLTLPILLDSDVVRRVDLGRATGLLYGANTLGAVAGALLGEVWLIATFGVRGTAVVAATLSTAAALLACTLAAHEPRSAGGSLVTPPDPTAALPRLGWRLVLTSFGAGMLLLSLEVVWTRFLKLYLASSATAFALMLAAVLSGLGLGGLARGLFGRPNDRDVAPILLLGAAVGTLATYLLFPVPARALNAGGFYMDQKLTMAGLSLALMFPVALLSGWLFPTIIALADVGRGDRRRSAGIVTLWNTIGAAVGPLLASFVFLPSVGFQRTLVLCAFGYAVLAIAVCPRAAWSLRVATGVAQWALATLFVGLLVFFPYNRDEMHFANARRAYEIDGAHRVAHEEGTADTWQLLQTNVYAQPYYQRLVTNGYSMSGTHPRSQRYMRLFAEIPQVLRPETRRALLICYGVGVTADAFLRDPALEHLDIVDISPEVFALAASIRSGEGASPLRDPRVQTFVQDGRFFLETCPDLYDVISGEPPPLKVAGTVNLYTQEFFALMRGRLQPNGIATFWLPIYQLEIDEVKSILRAFHTAFPNASVWSGPDQEWVMVGVNGAGRGLTDEALRRLWHVTPVAEDLARHGLELPEQLPALFVMDAAEIERITANVAPLIDNFPKRLSDDPPDPEAIHRFAWTYMEGASAYERFSASPAMQRLWPDSVRKTLGPFFVLREIRYLAGITSSNWLAALDLYLRGSRLRTPVLEVFHTDEVRVRAAQALHATTAAPSADITSDLVAGALARRDLPAAIELLQAARTRGAGKTNDLLLLIYLQCVVGQVRNAEALAATSHLTADDYTRWLWQKLRDDFGFQPPR